VGKYLKIHGEVGKGVITKEKQTQMQFFSCFLTESGFPHAPDQRSEPHARVKIQVKKSKPVQPASVVESVTCQLNYGNSAFVAATDGLLLLGSRFAECMASEVEAALGRYDVAVVDRGQRSMVSQLLGDRVTYERVLLVGVACAATVALPDVYRRETPAGKSELESSHTAFFLVPGTRRTDEAAWLAKVASAFAGIDPSIALLIHGGDEAWQDVFAQLDEHRRVVALEGTGGIADLLSAAARGEHVDDCRVVLCIASGLIRTIPLDAVDEVKELVGVVTSLHPVSLR